MVANAQPVVAESEKKASEVVSAAKTPTVAAAVAKPKTRKRKAVFADVEKAVKQVGDSIQKAAKIPKVEKRKPGELGDDTVFMAALANSAYIRKKQYKEEAVNKVSSLRGYQLDEELTNAHMTVWENPESREVITAFRGTQSASDVAADAALFLNIEDLNPHFRHSVRSFEKVYKKYPHDDHTLTGHSLGGSTAMYVAENAGKEKRKGGPKRDAIRNAIKHVEVFNHGSAARDVKRGLRPYTPLKVKTGKQRDSVPTTVHTVEGDIVSMLAPTLALDPNYTVVSHKQLAGSTNAHSIQQYLK